MQLSKNLSYNYNHPEDTRQCGNKIIDVPI